MSQKNIGNWVKRMTVQHPRYRKEVSLGPQIDQGKEVRKATLRKNNGLGYSSEVKYLIITYVRLNSIPSATEEDDSHDNGEEKGEKVQKR